MLYHIGYDGYGGYGGYGTALGCLVINGVIGCYHLGVVNQC